MVVDFHAYFQTRSFLDRLRQRSAYPYIEKTARGEVIWSGPGAARRIRPEQTDIALGLADALMRANRTELAAKQVDEAVVVLHRAFELDTPEAERRHA